ncbi:hypothetical protein EIN_273000 [Entamoeba invadens IP1]|uniref:Uncharacterized protein n=1 Tax=Entamoeba invadens IP1 TaxID=370355 RepID=L7FQC4_ENTIV|nr:hypothetical protein EIN_273000 [Entamoeba invadens IP1]ELP93687.1 hypothetical protein EIN_273000 [Entamoeba invadens IP1]|eukprot:XP_004260458.1 hypothetical protein EIN_273000 [Entamoeba invadens IP1]
MEKVGNLVKKHVGDTCTNWDETKTEDITLDASNKIQNEYPQFLYSVYQYFNYDDCKYEDSQALSVNVGYPVCSASTSQSIKSEIVGEKLKQSKYDTTDCTGDVAKTEELEMNKCFDRGLNEYQILTERKEDGCSLVFALFSLILVFLL